MISADVEVIVAGAGVVGLCTALQLQRRGREVLLVDRAEPGTGASSGNAGVIATYECVPVGTPHVLKSLPRLLLDASSPLSISPSALPRLWPWLLRFARASLEENAKRSAVALVTLLKNGLPQYEELIEYSGAHDLFCRAGALHLFRDELDLAAASWERDLRQRLGIKQTVLDRRDLEALEPALPTGYPHGILFPDAAHVTDPLELMRRLTRAFVENGGRIARAEICELRHSNTGITLIGTTAKLRSRTVVIALGSWSATLTRQIGDRIPLDSERGYHVEFPNDSPPLRRPICPVHLGFYLTPMSGRLRAAGTVELSSIEHIANPKRWELIERSTRKLFPGLPPATTKWLGFRPSLPDSLPVIGRSPRARNVVYAFGHGHLGLTLAAETARLVCDIIIENAEPVETIALSPARFG